MSPKAIAVAGLSAIALAASGCGGDSDPEAEFRAAFKKKFGEETWYHHITGIGVKDDGLDVSTDFDPKRPFAFWGLICEPARGVAIETGAIESSEFVHVRGRDGVGGVDCA